MSVWRCACRRGLRASLLHRSALIFLHDPQDVRLISCGSHSIDALCRDAVGSFFPAARLYFISNSNRQPASPPVAGSHRELEWQMARRPEPGAGARYWNGERLLDSKQATICGVATTEPSHHPVRPRGVPMRCTLALGSYGGVIAMTKSAKYSRIPTADDIAAFTGMHCARKYRDAVDSGWRCPCCGRTAQQLIRWTEIRGPSWRARFGDAYGMGFSITMAEHHCHGDGRFPDTLICGDCNSADGAAKRKLRLPESGPASLS